MCHSLKIYVLFPGNICVILRKYMFHSLKIYALFPENIRVIPWKYSCYSLEIYVLFSGAPFCAIYNLPFVRNEKLKLFFCPKPLNSAHSPTKQGKGYEIGLLQKQNELIAG